MRESLCVCFLLEVNNTRTGRAPVLQWYPRNLLTPASWSRTPVKLRLLGLFSRHWHYLRVEYMFISQVLYCTTKLKSDSKVDEGREKGAAAPFLAMTKAREVLQNVGRVKKKHFPCDLLPV